MEIQTAVIGLGQMGQGILQRLIEAGLPAAGIGRREESLPGILDTLKGATTLAIRRKRTTSERVEQGLSRLRLTTHPAELENISLVLEALPEDFDIKVKILASLAGTLPPEVTLASNTSSLSIQRLGSASRCAPRLLGLHFMNPVSSSTMVELVTTEALDDYHHQKGLALTQALGLTAIEVRDSPGFIVNRLLMPVIAEATRLLEEGSADVKAIDSAMRMGCGHPMGPLALADMIGLDVIQNELEELGRVLGARYSPPEYLRQLVKEGKLGRKSGEGFHNYGGKKQASVKTTSSVDGLSSNG